MGEPKLLPGQYESHAVRSILDKKKPGTQIDRVGRLVGYIAATADDMVRQEGVQVNDPFITYRNHILRKHDAWVRQQQTDIERISAQSLTNKMSELNYLYEDTKEFEDSIIVQLSTRARQSFPFARETHMANVAIRMLLLEAKGDYLDDLPPPYEP